MGEREPVRSYLQKIVGEQAACRRHREEIYRQNGQLLTTVGKEDKFELEIISRDWYNRTGIRFNLRYN